MTTSNKVSWGLVVVLSIALTKACLINKNADQSAPIPTKKELHSIFDRDMYPGSTPKSAYKGTIQVNKLPFPFNMNGTMPYQVWVDGERLPLNGDQADRIIDALELAKGDSFVQPDDTAEIHAGAGWQFPLPPQNLQ